MNKGVEILIERMKSNPDEFIPTKPYGNLPSKWADFIRAMFARKRGDKGEQPFGDLPFLSDEDVEAFHAKLNEVRADHFTKEVMSTLLTDDSSHKESEDSFEYNVNTDLRTYARELMDKQAQDQYRKLQEDYIKAINEEHKMKAQVAKAYLMASKTK